MTQAHTTATDKSHGHGRGLRSSRKPRYLQIAHTLSEEIRHGTYPVGRHLPPETALCKRFGISRYTVREALRVMEETGLISRRRGSGTTVRSIEAHVHYNQTIRTADELMQYVNASAIQFLYTDRVHADSRLAGWLNVRVGTECVQMHVIRYHRRTKEPYCIADLYRRASWQGLPAGYTRMEDALRAVVDEGFQQYIGKVEQTLSAIALTDEQAHELHVSPNTPGFRSVRHYFDLKGRLVFLAVAVHPGHMFSYHSRYERSEIAIRV